MIINGSPALPEHDKKGIYIVETYGIGSCTIIELLKELILKSYFKN